MLNKKKLARFCEIRNASPHNTNLQFEVDAQEAGFEVRHLGSAQRLAAGGYQWITDWGTLIERPNGRMEFEPATYL